MAANYSKAKRPCRPWRPADHQAFDEIRNSLQWESYPNGNSGWDSRGITKFIAAGFEVVGGHGRGNPATPCSYVLDLGPSRK